jgi:cytochrome c oxidase subunit 3
MTDDTADTGRLPLPVGTTGTSANGWYGMWGLVATEGSLFAFLLFGYYYLLFHSNAPWPPDGLPSFRISGPGTLILLASSGVIWWAEHEVRRGHRLVGALIVGLTLVMGVVFIALQLMEWAGRPFAFGGSPYASLYFTITGFHMAHVVVGLLVLAALLVWTALGYFDGRRNVVFRIGALYWHFVDAVWIFVFSTFYLSPYLLR